MDVRGGPMLGSTARVGREYRDPQETNPNPNRVSTLAASPAPPTPAHGATCHPLSASPTRSGAVLGPPRLPLPASPAALIGLPRPRRPVPLAWAAAQPPPCSRFRQQLAGGPGVPAARGARYPPPRRPQLPKKSRVPSGQPRPMGSRAASRPPPERSTCGAEVTAGPGGPGGDVRVARLRQLSAHSLQLCCRHPRTKTAVSSCTLCLGLRGCFSPPNGILAGGGRALGHPQQPAQCLTHCRRPTKHFIVFLKPLFLGPETTEVQAEGGREHTEVIF